MATIKVQNYIHTLFAFEFQLPWAIVSNIRICLQRNCIKNKLYFEWISNNIQNTDIPKLKFSKGWSLFESEQDLKTYDE